jgi:cell division protein FtsB
MRFQLRSVAAWMVMVCAAASLLLAMVWKQQAYVSLSRALQAGEKERARLHNSVLLLETEVRALRQPARLEALARDRFGLIHPGPPILVQPSGQILARAVPGERAPLRLARWLERLPWPISGW